MIRNERARDAEINNESTALWPMESFVIDTAKHGKVVGHRPKRFEFDTTE